MYFSAFSLNDDSLLSLMKLTDSVFHRDAASAITASAINASAITTSAITASAITASVITAGAITE
jgi:hypothetical protein